MSSRLTKPWIDLESVASESLPAQLGVFELADDTGRVIYIGYGGGNTAFGLRTAIEAEAARLGSRASRLRYELTHGYLSRWEELMMVHRHDHGSLPEANDPATAPPGRLTPTADPARGTT